MKDFFCLFLVGAIILLLLWKPLKRFTKSTEKQMKCIFRLAQHPSFKHITGQVFCFFCFWLCQSDRFSFLEVYWEVLEASLELLFIRLISVTTLWRNKQFRMKGEWWRVNCKWQIEYLTGCPLPNFLIQSLFPTEFTPSTISKG